MVPAGAIMGKPARLVKKRASGAAAGRCPPRNDHSLQSRQHRPSQLSRGRRSGRLTARARSCSSRPPDDGNDIELPRRRIQFRPQVPRRQASRVLQDSGHPLHRATAKVGEQDRGIDTGPDQDAEGRHRKAPGVVLGPSLKLAQRVGAAVDRDGEESEIRLGGLRSTSHPVDPPHGERAVARVMGHVQRRKKLILFGLCAQQGASLAGESPAAPWQGG